MRIFGIEIYRDGGSLEFRIEGDFGTNHIFLETPFSGEPRALLIDSVLVSKGSAEVSQLLDHIEMWWKSLPPEQQKAALEVQSHKGPHYHPLSKLEEQAINFSRVLNVRDYVKKHYSA